MSEHNYNATQSACHHTTANASGDDNSADRLAANFSKIDNVQIKL